MPSGKSVRSQSPWLTIVNNLDNVPRSDPEDPGTFLEFFDGYWTFLIAEGNQNSPVSVGYIANLPVKMIHWSRHPGGSTSLFNLARSHSPQ